MHDLFPSHVPNAHTLSHRTASHSYVNVAYKSPVASRQRLAFSNVSRITYNLPHNHTRLRISIIYIPQQPGFHIYHSLIMGISTIQFPCPKPMICVVADLAIMSSFHENAMSNAMSFNINALKCIQCNMAFLYSI